MVEMGMEMEKNLGGVPSVIITHGGPAHADDLLAVAVVLAKFPNAIVVRLNDPAAISDPSAIYVDIGGRYDNERFFDHHQSKDLPASLILIMKRFYPEINTDIDELQWISDWDVMGPMATQKKWGVNLPEFRDPIVEVVLRMFSKAEVIKPGDMLHDMLIMLGSEFIEFLKEQKEFIRKAREAEVFEVKGLKVVGVSENVPVRFVKKVHHDVAIVVSPNQREPGKLTLTRIDDHPRVDFRRVRDMQGVSFVHANGFMAVVEPRVIIDAIERAIE